MSINKLPFLATAEQCLRSHADSREPEHAQPYQATIWEKDSERKLRNNSEKKRLSPLLQTKVNLASKQTNQFPSNPSMVKIKFACHY